MFNNTYEKTYNGQPNALGIYRDPVSGASLKAIEVAQADAFVRLGWQLQLEVPENTIITPQLEEELKVPQELEEQKARLGRPPKV